MNPFRAQTIRATLLLACALALAPANSAPAVNGMVIVVVSVANLAAATIAFFVN